MRAHRLSEELSRFFPSSLFLLGSFLSGSSGLTPPFSCVVCLSRFDFAFPSFVCLSLSSSSIVLRFKLIGCVPRASLQLRTSRAAALPSQYQVAIYQAAKEARGRAIRRASPQSSWSLAVHRLHHRPLQHQEEQEEAAPVPQPRVALQNSPQVFPCTCTLATYMSQFLDCCLLPLLPFSCISVDVRC